MFKKTLFAVFGLAMALAFASPEKAHAGVAIGVTVGGPVVYAHPAYPYAYGYVRPVPYPPAYVYARPYPGPYAYGFYRGPYWRHERFERHEYVEHRGYYGHDRR
jgi:hypothetical protein